MASDRIYRIAGTAQTTAGPQATRAGITNPRRAVPGVGRDSGGAALEVRGDELVRVTLDNGFVFWSRADGLLRERGHETRSRGGDNVWQIDTSPPGRAKARGGTRGWLGLGIQVLEFSASISKGRRPPSSAMSWSSNSSRKGHLGSIAAPWATN